MDPKEVLIQSLLDEGYLKTSEIIQAFRAIDRADFVLPEYQQEAYGNYPLPIGSGQTISQPLTVAFLLELLEPKPGDKILDIGSGSGWTTALLAQIISRQSGTQSSKRKAPARRRYASSVAGGQNDGKVFGLERIPEICELGKKNLAKYFDQSRAKIICADGTQGLLEEAPFDKILAGAAAPMKSGRASPDLIGRAALQSIPRAWRDQLKVGGRIVAPVAGSVWLFVKKSETEWEEKEFPGFAFVPLVKEPGNYRSPTSILKPDFDRFGENKNFFIFCLLSLALAAGLLYNEIFLPHSRTEALKRVEISEGLGARKIAERLKEEGVIRSKWTFVFYAAVRGAARQLKPGVYAFGSSALPEITRDLMRGANYERVLTVPEGWSLPEISQYMRRQEFVFATDFEEAAQDKEVRRRLSERFPFLAEIPAALGLEGYLFPDTYRVFQDDSSERVLVKMLENFDKKLTSDLRAEIARRKKTVFETVVMASLIEKEVASDEDRALVSGILWKRLEIGIPLQVDATITYIKEITNHKSQITNTDGRISLADLQITSPYNTYLYRGLPVGPISNPGLSAIRAAVYPRDSSYFYYLSAKDGQTIFSRTLEEHNEAKVRYLR